MIITKLYKLRAQICSGDSRIARKKTPIFSKKPHVGAIRESPEKKPPMFTPNPCRGDSRIARKKPPIFSKTYRKLGEFYRLAILESPLHGVLGNFLGIG
jgi:hypothetical protein